jgi:hypothetical protein
MTIYHRWDGFSCLKRCKISELEHNHTDTCLAWSGDSTNTPQIHSHGIWCDVGRRISNETTICHRGKWIPSFLWNDAEKQLTQEEWPTMSLLSIVQETSVKYSKPCFLWCIWVSTYGDSFGRNDNLPSLGPIYLTSFKPPSQARRPPSTIWTMWTATWLRAYQGGSSFLLLWHIEGIRKCVGHPPTRMVSVECRVSALA